MSDTPTKIVLDCSHAGKPDMDLADRLKQEAFGLFERGAAASTEGERQKLTDAAANVMRQAADVLARSSLATETVVELDADELAQRDVDQAAHAELASELEQQQADREALVQKLAAGKASSAEVQAALAQLLG